MKRFRGKHRVSKEDLKEDRFQVLTEKVAAAYYRDRQRFWVIGGVVLAVVVGVILLLQNRSSGVNSEAQLRLTEALGVYTQGNVQQAEEFFTNLVTRFGKDPAGVKGRYYLGQIYYNTQRYDEAKQEFLRFLKSQRRNPVLSPAASMGIGNCEEELGDFSEAARWYEKTFRDYPDWPLAADAMMAAGRAHVRAGDLKEAEAVYRELLDKEPTGDKAEDIKVQLAYVKALQEKL